MVNELEKLANEYFDNKQIFQAEPLLKKVIANNPNNADALYKLGYINFGKSDYKVASMLLDASFKINHNMKALLLLAHTKEKMNEFFDAIVLYEMALEIKPSPDIYEKISALYLDVELYDNAIQITKEYTEKYPTIIAYRRLFLMYLGLSKNEEAKNICDEIQQKFKNQGLALNMLGIYQEYVEQNFEEAKKQYEKASKLGAITASYDLAKCYKKMKMYDEAEKYCKKALEVYPSKEDVYFLLTEIHFIQKKMRKGYKDYLKRPLPREIKRLKNKWDGKTYNDKTILVYSDIDDIGIIRNLRYISELKNKFKNIIIAAPVNFLELLNFNKYKTVKYDEISQIEYDKHVLLSELQYFLNMSFENIPNQKIKAEKKDLDGNFKVGLLWQSQTSNLLNYNILSIDICKYLKPLLERKEITFYSFQKNDIFGVLDKFKNIKDLSLDLNNYKDYADFIFSMDLIISVDSPMLHLAGSLNIPAYAMIFNNSAWYWFDNNHKTEWYKSVEIFKQLPTEDLNIITKKIIEKVNNGKSKKIK